MDRRLAFGALFCVTLGLAACTTGGGNVTSPNPLNPTPGPTASPAPPPTPTPTATATSSPSGACPPTYPSTPATETIPLPPGGGTFSIPNFGDFLGTATTPSLSQGAGATVTLNDSTQNFDSIPLPAGQTGVFFVRLTLSATVTFSNQNIPTVITAGCTIVPGATYTANVYALGGPVQPQQTAVANGHTLNFTIVVPPNGSGGGSFPGSVPADVAISR